MVSFLAVVLNLAVRTLTISTPFSAKALIEALLSSRVIARMRNSFDSCGWANTARTTEPPWLPDAPNTARIFDMMDFVAGFSRLEE